jgi:ectoine hydroxylase-related dioxygenase (phytanoyl-CoA dioxygenase family)
MKLSPEELSEQVLKPETIATAIQQIRLYGYVYFESVMPHDFVDELRVAFLNAFNAKLDEKPEATEVNTSEFRKNRTRFFLPFEQPFIDPRVLLNPFILPIVEEILGKDIALTYMAVDAPLPGSDYQVVHSDAKPFYPETSVTLPPAGLFMNIALIDITEHNGPMEVWPGGTHLMPESMNRMENIRGIAQMTEPSKVTIPKGSLLIRDPRMWHRGTPNNSDEIRPIMVLQYARPWWRNHYVNTLGVREDIHDALPERIQQLVRFEDFVTGPIHQYVPGSHGKPVDYQKS